MSKTKPDGSPPVGGIRFGDLRRTVPISRIWGYDRGTPIDRHYIEGFLERRGADVRGRVLEVGDARYTRRFGGDRVSRSEVLNVKPGLPDTTIVADLQKADHVASNSFDCIVMTQTLQLIFDLRAAVATLHRILAPGGVLLATFPGITHIGDVDWGHQWYWNLTTHSARRLFADFFPRQSLDVQAHGNVLVATAFLHGIAAEELTVAEFEARDPAFELVITVRARKEETV